jgi:hypothetical protein
MSGGYRCGTCGFTGEKGEVRLHVAQEHSGDRCEGDKHVMPHRGCFLR